MYLHVQGSKLKTGIRLVGHRGEKPLNERHQLMRKVWE